MEDPEFTSASFPITRIPRPQILLSRHLFPLANSLHSCSSTMNLPAATTSRQDPDALYMNDFWREVETIKQTQGSEGDDSSSSEASTPEEGEAEAEWLQDTGLSPLIGDQSPAEDNVFLLSTLTHTQAAAVQRRVDSYSRSLRKRGKQTTRDVRDIFTKASSITEVLLEENETEQKNNPSANTEHTQTSHTPGVPNISSSTDVFNTDVAYSEQAASRLKMCYMRKSHTAEHSGSLPTFQMHKGRLGVTRVSDLSPADMKQVLALVLIELTALCDVLDLDLKRNKAVKRKATESHLFGVALNTMLEHDQKMIPNTKVPLIMQAILTCLEKNGLETKGILRVSGSQARVKSLQQRLERDFYAGLFSWDDVNPHDASGLLKLFLRELPAPLLTAEYLPAFTAIQYIPDLKERLQALNLLILLLPEPNRHTLKALLEFLRKVASLENSNLMSLWNISTIMAPNLFLYRGNTSKIPEGCEKQVAEGTANLVMAMVHYQDLLWTVPSFLVSQVRKLNENSSKRYPFGDRRLRNFLRKIHADKDKAEKILTEPCKQVKIRTSHFLKDSLAVRLEEGTRAADVLQQFQKHLGQRSLQMVSAVGLIKWYIFNNLYIICLCGILAI
ncbi:rho GTPase-activating protein 40 isoform X1 [Bombina bombina]|uniref:rho GTPase-activating protein 40 isoform X1 n=2 Tax=Bombina bombina TaxID=8345 RepID=UPI00235A6906|nr:rho GTPase-activating protein 40 isoform X1 [Bombina bombina]